MDAESNVQVSAHPDKAVQPSLTPVQSRERWGASWDRDTVSGGKQDAGDIDDDDEEEELSSDTDHISEGEVDEREEEDDGDANSLDEEAAEGEAEDEDTEDEDEDADDEGRWRAAAEDSEDSYERTDQGSGYHGVDDSDSEDEGKREGSGSRTDISKSPWNEAGGTDVDVEGASSAEAVPWDASARTPKRAAGDASLDVEFGGGGGGEMFGGDVEGSSELPERPNGAGQTTGQTASDDSASDAEDHAVAAGGGDFFGAGMFDGITDTYGMDDVYGNEQTLKELDAMEPTFESTFEVDTLPRMGQHRSPRQAFLHTL